MSYARGWLLLLLAMPLAAAELRVAHVAPQGVLDVRTEYPLALLRLALVEAGVDFRLQQTEEMHQSRALKLLEQDQGIDVVWTMTSVEREAKLRPIRIPLCKGLIGWRVLLVRGDQLGRFTGLEDDQLRQLSGGQGHDWPDTQILQANGFNVMPITGHESLFEMLNRGRIQHFPRSVIEVMDELNNHPDMALAIEPGLLLYYPTAFYFFVHPDNDALAKALEQGLERAIANGKFDALFNQVHGPMLAALNIQQRRVIALENPLLPAATPLARQQLWLLPQQCGTLCAPDVITPLDAVRAR